MFSRDDEAVKELERLVRGAIILPGDAGYEHATEVFNRDVVKRPEMIVQAKGSSDIVRAVMFANARKVSFTVAGESISTCRTLSCCERSWVGGAG